MSFKIIAFVLPLGLDTLALAIALGLRGLRPWRPDVLFTAFETIMPIFGIALARVVGKRFETAAVVLGGVVLIAIGIRALRESTRDEAEEIENLSFGSVRSSLLAGIAISTDELAVGFPLGASHLPVATVLAAIAVQTFLFTTLGVTLGNRVRARLARGAARSASIGAGIVFTLVGLWLIGERLAR